MHWNNALFVIFICMTLTVFARRELYESKCKRNCNTESGSLDCWKETIDGFSYGLSTAMIDFCQVILKIRNLTDGQHSWYNISRDIISKQIKEYELDDEVRQLTKENIEQIAVALLDQCFHSLPSVTSFEPSCSSCSATQKNYIKQWRLSSIILISIGLFLVIIISLLYAFRSYSIHHSYSSIKIFSS